MHSSTTIDDEIIERTGKESYHDVFQRAMADASGEGQRYEDIRDVASDISVPPIEA